VSLYVPPSSFLHAEDHFQSFKEPIALVISYVVLSTSTFTLLASDSQVQDLYKGLNLRSLSFLLPFDKHRHPFNFELMSLSCRTQGTDLLAL
jgi:hypothetical protein